MCLISSNPLCMPRYGIWLFCNSNVNSWSSCDPPKPSDLFLPSWYQTSFLSPLNMNACSFLQLGLWICPHWISSYLFFRIFLWFFEVTSHSLMIQHGAACAMPMPFVNITSIFSIPLLGLVMKILKDAGPCKDVFWTVNTSSLTVCDSSLNTLEYSHWVPLNYSCLVTTGCSPSWGTPVPPAWLGKLHACCVGRLSYGHGSSPAHRGTHPLPWAQHFSIALFIYITMLQHYFVLYIILNSTHLYFPRGTHFTVTRGREVTGKLPFWQKSNFMRNFRKCENIDFVSTCQFFNFFFPFSQVFLFHSLL